MAYAEMTYEVLEESIAKLTLNRPEKRNPLSPATIGELVAAFEAAKADAAVRAVVLTGAGKVFSAGGDLSAMSGGGPAAAKPASLVDLFLTMSHLGKPIIAMVNGHAMAGGLGLMVACDLAIASDAAQFGTPEINVGLWPMMIMAQIFRNVSRKAAMELILTGDRIDARAAERIGLINRAVPAGDLEHVTLELARKLAKKSPMVMKMGLSAFYETQDMDLERALPYLQAQLLAVLATEDAREGLTAFFEKREPQWKGR
jgi:enoyl-CoA hydratase/carnithine racemase